MTSNELVGSLFVVVGLATLLALAFYVSWLLGLLFLGCYLVGLGLAVMTQ